MAVFGFVHGSKRYTSPGKDHVKVIVIGAVSVSVSGPVITKAILDLSKGGVKVIVRLLILVAVPFDAETVKVYEEPFVRPVHIIGDRGLVKTSDPEVAVYCVIADPPFDTGGENARVAIALPVTTDKLVGLPGVNDVITRTGVVLVPMV